VEEGRREDRDGETTKNFPNLTKSECTDPWELNGYRQETLRCVLMELLKLSGKH
jgi:hypothetical protein